MISSSFLIIFYVSGITFLIAGGLLLFAISHFRKRRRIVSILNHILYEVTLPQEIEAKKEGTSFRDLISIMEQFYTGMSALFEGGWFRGRASYALELALPSVGEETTFYVAVPRGRARLFEKQLQSLFPHARVEVKIDDYNLFNPEGGHAAAYATLAENPALPIRTYHRLDADPLEVVANAFSKLKKQGEGAALQIIVSRAPPDFRANLKEILKSLRQGKDLKKPKKGWGGVIAEASSFLITGKGETKKAPEERPVVDEELIKLVEEKSGFPMMSANIRLVASAASEEEAEMILKELTSAFLQFSEPRGNGFNLVPARGKERDRLLYQFSFRMPDKKKSIPLNSRELTSIYHFPSRLLAAPKLKVLRAKDAPAPAGLPAEGLLLGENIYQGEKTEVRLTTDDRRRHFYIIGQTGTGKTVFLQNMIRQDIEAGNGLAVIDPHGDMVDAILGYVPEKRIEDVIYFDPADTARPMGLNFLEYDPAYPEQKTFVVNELLEIFKKLYADVPEALGPMFETYFRNATLLVIEDPASGNTLLEISRVMADESFRAHKLSRSKNPVVNSFWKDIAEKAGGEAALANMVPYITSKFDAFLTNEIMRPILLQEHSSFDFRDIMDQKKIFLVNLSKGRVGETNAALLGLIIVGKLLMAALSRVNIPEEERKDFYLYLDEFQNVTTPSIATILSEARKYRLSLIMAHQFIGQLSDDIKRAVFGNVGSMCTFRIGAEDGEFMEKQFEPVFSAHDLQNIENYHAYVKLLVGGQTTKPFNIKTPPATKGNPTLAKSLKELSAQKYGRARAEVEADINRRFEQKS
ncbi:DUF853 family protein [Patescibacteria group bacterium]|nr:DUF853 family protein [Patescibacteria group bacterium]